MANVASALPDDFVEGSGLPDDFDGSIVEARYIRWDYNGSIDTPVLGARITIKPDDKEVNDDENVVAVLSAGSLEAFVPSEDGESESEEGPFALQVGKKEQLNNSTNWSQFLGSVIDCEVPRNHFKPDIRFLEGINGHFNRLPSKRKGSGGQAMGKSVLCMTALHNLGKPAPATKGGKAVTGGNKVAAGKPKSADGDLKALVAEIVQAEGGPVKKGKLAGLVLKKVKGSHQDKQKAVKAITNEFLADIDDCVFDEDEGTITHTENI